MTALLTRTRPRTTPPAAPAGRHRLRRVGLAVQEMNHAARRLVQLQAPWSVDKHWHTS